MFGILRTILAVFVVLLHIFSIPRLGNFAVTFFFVLSGFLMTLIMHKTYKFSSEGFIHFWTNRILRLYPSYFLILGLSILVILYFNVNQLNKSMIMPGTIKSWFSNITMVYFDIVPHRINARIVPTSWALTNELFFYFLISLGISKTFNRTLLWFALSVFYYVGTYYFYDLATFRYSAIPASSLPFAIGALLFWLTTLNIKKWSFSVNMFTVTILTLLFFANAFYLGESGILFYQEMSIYYNYIIAFSLLFILFRIRGNPKFKRVDTYIGYFSYPIYLSHYLVSALYIYFLKENHISPKLDFNDFIFYFIVLISFCFFIVHFVDIKVDNFKKRLNERTKFV